jgi:hypothetical protein
MQQKTVHLSELRSIAILFPGDLYQLASVLLQGFDALAPSPNASTRPTLHGLAGTFTYLFRELDRDRVEATLRKRGFDLGAVVEWDEIDS